MEPPPYDCIIVPVAPRRGAWIEMEAVVSDASFDMSLPAGERGLK